MAGKSPVCKITMFLIVILRIGHIIDNCIKSPIPAINFKLIKVECNLVKRKMKNTAHRARLVRILWFAGQVFKFTPFSNKPLKYHYS